MGTPQHGRRAILASAARVRVSVWDGCLGFASPGSWVWQLRRQQPGCCRSPIRWQRTSPTGLQLPSVKFWLGTDQLGRDMLARVVYGARVSLTVAFCTALIAAVFGMLLGLPAGYFRGRTEMFLMGAADVGLAFPPSS